MTHEAKTYEPEVLNQYVPSILVELEQLRDSAKRARQLAHVPHAILRFPDVKSLTGYSRSTIYRCIAQGLFTKPVRLSERAVGWPFSEIATLNAAHIAGKSTDEIRALVGQLHARRKLNAG